MWNRDWELKSWGQFKPVGETDYQKVMSLTQHLKTLCKMNKIGSFYIEYPMVMSQQIALSGNLTKLAWGVGVICGALLPLKMTLVEVKKWKGQLPKEIVAKRIDKRLPGLNIESHAYDAIGIGLFMKGEF